MTDEKSEGREQRLDQPTVTTGIMRGAGPIEGLEGSISPAYESPPPEPVYIKEPLFSKKVMLGWATAAFVVWFAFTFIVPPVVEAVKTAVVSAMEEPGSNTATKTVIRTRNGVTITRTESGVTIEREGTTPTTTTPRGQPVVIPDPAPAAMQLPPAKPDAPKKAAGENPPRR